MLGFAGLAVDVSLWYFDKRTALGASDSAAFSAIVTYNADVAAGLSSTNAQTNAVAAAKAVTATYGYANGVNGVTVTVNDPPKSGSHKSPPSGSVAFEVIVTKTEPQFFSGLFVSGVSVTGRSVAEVSTSAAKNGAAGAGCIEQFAASGSVNMSNGVSVTTKSCAIYGNGTGSAALSVTGGANLTVDGINLVGSITQNQGGAINNSGTKLTGQAATPDPYASYTISAAETTAASEASADASAASKAGAGYTPSGSCPNSTPTSFSTGGKTTTIYPGFYCGGLTAGNNNNIIMSPGVYVVVGGQFSMQGGITVTATGGVTVVLTGSGSNYATANIAKHRLDRRPGLLWRSQRAPVEHVLDRRRREHGHQWGHLHEESDDRLFQRHQQRRRVHAAHRRLDRLHRRGRVHQQLHQLWNAGHRRHAGRHEPGHRRVTHERGAKGDR
jgi:hypothetical protein